MRNIRNILSVVCGYAACLNRAAGETVKANTPGGEIEFKILSIEK